MQQTIVYTLDTIADVITAARAEIAPGGIVTLAGLLGAGKTTFVQRIVASFGITEPVLSPTYSYVSTYKNGSLSIYHFDLYRISGIEEFESLGFGEYLNDPQALVFIEWPDRIASLLERIEYRDRVISFLFKYRIDDEKKREIQWFRGAQGEHEPVTIFENE